VPTKLLFDIVQSSVVQECLQPSAAISGVAISHGINANVIRKWMPRTEISRQRCYLRLFQ